MKDFNLHFYVEEPSLCHAMYRGRSTRLAVRGHREDGGTGGCKSLEVPATTTLGKSGLICVSSPQDRAEENGGSLIRDGSLLRTSSDKTMPRVVICGHSRTQIGESSMYTYFRAVKQVAYNPRPVSRPSMVVSRESSSGARPSPARLRTWTYFNCHSEKECSEIDNVQRVDDREETRRERVNADEERNERSVEQRCKSGECGAFV